MTSFRVVPFLGVRATWIARITEFEWNHHFADIQVKGPFRVWRHRHELQAETREGVAGTVVRDTIECQLGFGSGWRGGSEVGAGTANCQHIPVPAKGVAAIAG